ncbi:MAG: nitrophenyl compound nitroreductase subunit ArsF family protein [Planctomycetaceae bacterium]|nr:nitrophenyl compound nitroreductase subunit ArsF family protein [Planctomycetaceae bacterium]
MKQSTLIVGLGILGLILNGCAQSDILSSAPAAGAASPADRVDVYYMHRTLRCISCLTIERNTRQALQDTFAAEMRDGRVTFHVADYWINTELAQRYNVDTVSVIVVTVVKGKEVSHENLDRVWSLKGDSQEFRTYIVDAVRAAQAKTATAASRS